MKNPYRALLQAADDHISEMDNHKSEAAVLLLAVLVVATIAVAFFVGDFLFDIHWLAGCALFIYPLIRLWLRGYRHVTKGGDRESTKA